METKIALFQKKEIRKLIHENEWWFVVEDVVLALIESRDPKQYIQRMKQRDPELGKGQGNRIKTRVILRRSDARRAQVAGIAQPKNPVCPRESSGPVSPFADCSASHGILHSASAHHLAAPTLHSG